MKNPTADLPKVPVFGEGDFDGTATEETQAAVDEVVFLTAANKAPAGTEAPAETEEPAAVEAPTPIKSTAIKDEVVFLEPSSNEAEQSESASDSDELVFLTSTDTEKDDATVVTNESTADASDSSVNDELVFLTPENECSQQTEESDVNFVLDKKITIKCIDDFESKLNFDIAITKEVIFDGGEVEIIDTAGLQVLVGVVNKAKAASKNISWSGASDELKQLSSVLALNDHLGL